MALFNFEGQALPSINIFRNPRRPASVRRPTSRVA
jgi:hypothetical protein